MKEPKGRVRDVWHRLSRDRAATAGAMLVLLTLFCALAAPLISPADPLKMNPAKRLAPPLTPGHPLGTDGNGRDVLSRLIYGSRTALAVALLPVVFSSVVGTALGLAAGYFGGSCDNAIMRVCDVLFAFPSILLAIAIVAALGPSPTNAIFALTVVFIPAFARLVRAQALSLREQEFVLAAESCGAGSVRVIGRHIFANVLPTIIVFATLQTGQMVVFGAALSFLGLGVQPPVPDWGAMANEGRYSILIAPWVTTIPGIAIFVVTIGFNMLGDGLRDALDPQLKV